MLFNHYNSISFSKNELFVDVFQNVLLFLLNPVFSICFIAFNAVKNNRKEYLLLFAIVVALFASGINVTKIPAGDQVAYLLQFQQVRSEGFISTLMFGSRGSMREPLYGLYVFFCNYLFLESSKAFFFCTSFLIFLFHYLAMINIGKKYDYSNYLIISGIIVLTFFSQFFSLSLHLVRQLLATGVVFYAISLKILNDKKYICWMLIAFFIHSTSILPAILSFLPKISEELKRKNLLFFVSIVIIFTFSFTLVSKVFVGDSHDANVATYALSRAKDAKGLSDRADGANMDQLYIYIISIPLMLISLSAYIFKRLDVSGMFINLCICMCLFVCLVSFSPLIQYRYFFFLYSFFIFILPIAFKDGSLISKIYCSCMSLFMIVRFFFVLPQSQFQYADIINLLFYPFPLLFSLTAY